MWGGVIKKEQIIPEVILFIFKPLKSHLPQDLASINHSFILNHKLNLLTIKRMDLVLYSSDL